MSGSSNSSVQEFSIRVPKHVPKKHHVMRFNANLGIDFSKWTQVKMERENNMKEFKGIEEDQPKFGAGSEFGREAKEEARRKKLGIITRKYKPEDQPWILKLFSGSVKKFKGIREGGVSENAAYYVFTHAADGAIEAFPLYEWYKFQPIQRYKALSAEEAELEFSKRNKHLNYFSLMLRKRLKGDEEGLEEEEKAGKSKKGKSKDLKISEIDEWMDTSDDDSDDDNEKGEDDEDKNEKKKQKKQKAAPKKKKRDTDLEAVEDSDDGDDEGRELDYISDSSASEPEDTKLEGVAEEKALRKLLNSDEEDSEEEEKSEKEEGKEDEEDKEKDGEKKEQGEEKEKSKSKSKKKNKKELPKKEKKDGSSDEFSSDSSTDEDIKKQKAEKKGKKGDSEKDKVKDKDLLENENSLSDSFMSDNKRNLSNSGSSSSMPPSKKPKLENPIPNYIPGANESGITEEAVRKYLMRKPMTTTELLQKFKSKKTGLSSEQLVTIMTQILKKINPVKQTLKGKMYLSIK